MRTKNHRLQHGMSLVELMVAMVISLILTFGVVQIFLSSKQSYVLHEGISRIQENSRFATEELQRELRMAGFTGCSQNITNWVQPGGASYIFDNTIPLSGWEAGGTGVGDSYTISGFAPGSGSWSNGTGEALPGGIQPVPGTDVLVLNRGVRAEITLTGNPGPPANAITADGATGIPQGAIVTAVTSNCSGGDMFQKSSNASAVSLPKGVGGTPGNLNPSGGFSQAYDDDASIYVWQSVAYYIGFNADTGQPGLYRLRLDPGSAWGAGLDGELVEGVENMQVLYGRDTNGNGQVNDYVTAAAISDWSEVRSARVSLLFRSPERANTEDDPRNYNLIGTRIEPISDRRIRQVATTTIGIRNRLE